jgi:alpha-glucoside transport system substrate-binding protein
VRRNRSTSVAYAVLALWLVLLCALGSGDARATGAGGSVRVLATWTGSERDAFLTVLAGFTRKTGIAVDYQGTTAVREVLQSEVQAGTQPDIAVLPSPGELAEYAQDGALYPLDGVVAARLRRHYGAPWVQRLRPGGERKPAYYWMPVKTDLKSIVWHDARKQPTGLSRWCLGMGADATSGWPGTDWVEDILLQQSGPDAYRRWVTGRLAWDSPEVRQAWTTWGRMVTESGGAGAARRALVTHFEDAGSGMFDRPDSTSPGKVLKATCDLEHQGSFIRGGYRGAGHGKQVTFMPSADEIPRARRPSGVWEVSADLAAMFRPTPQAKQLMEYLSRQEAQKSLAAGFQSFSASDEVSMPDVYRDDPIGERIADTLADATTLCLDASDAMPATVRDAFQSAVLQFLDAPDDEGRLTRILRRLDLASAGARDAPRMPSVCS